jgi:SAM-dependent methyltransferase
MGLSRTKRTQVEQTRRPVSTYTPDYPMVRKYIDLSGDIREFEFGDLTRRDPFPIPMPIDREGYLPDHDHFYWASGHTDWLNVHSAIDEFNIVAQPNRQRLRLLDVGCASGRVLRHVHVFGSSFVEAWGTDLAPANIEWIKRYLPNEIHAIANESHPSLDFTDGFFDVVTGFSLMPHIDEHEMDWIRELKRIANRNGLIYLTVANEATWAIAAERENTIKHFENTNAVEGNSIFSKSTFEEPLATDRLVRKISNDDVYNCFIWHRNRYLHDNWGREIRIERIVDRAHLDYQSVLLARPNSD